ncbi:mucoidy inhibitor MuiA family protein [Geomonas sp. Red32]|uniref:mucoidy inhibitor MuiA family protein n=1 Tax=Geomonas sp. Red32 TaxID=2912856 RepID=UPI00202D0A30|nr:mucoidy inhibitor MuiA family protein [Geomonas sp. Red32]MCM0081688.1 mucoidy inhibitor MuiA family protein [Geomonas sp. Red32]
MKSGIGVVSLFLVLTLPFPALAADHTVKASSRITSVTVYLDRAQVTRHTNVQLKAGGNLVTLEGLPQTMVEKSVRVEGEGPGTAKLEGISVKKVFLERVQEQRIHALEDEITRLTAQVQAIDARKKGLAAQEAFLQSIKVGWGERISKELGAGKPSAAELGEASRFVGEGVGKVQEQLFQAEASKKPLLEKIEALRRELEQTKGEGMKEANSVQVAIDADREMTFSMDLSYLVMGTQWEPNYDLRLAADGKEAEITYRAQVWQNTGEDWPGVKLALSTANPEVGGAPPELAPWNVSFYEPPRIVAYEEDLRRSEAVQRYQAETGRVALGAAPPMPALAPMAKAAPMAAQVQEGQTSVLFAIARPVDVPTDGSHAGTVIAVNRVPVAAEYVTVPKLMPKTYLKSEVVNNTAYPLLPGEANIFNDTVFTGKTNLKNIAPGEKFDLFLGADDQIKVKRDVTKVKKKGGLLGSSSVSYHIAVELQNYKKRPVTVSVLDQLPIAGNAEIKVNLEEPSMKPAETKSDGTLIWKLDLTPGEKKKLTYDIVIEYPKDRELTGLQ